METVVLCFSPVAERPTLRKLMEEYSAKLDSVRGLNLPPHITIVSRFKTEQLPELKKKLTLACKTARSFSIQAEHIGAFEDSGLTAIHFKKSKELQKMHEKMLKIVSQYREPWVRDKLAEVEKNTRQKELTEKYGSPFVMEYFNAHLSLTGADVNKEKLEHLKLPKPFALTLNVDRVHILRKVGEEWKFDAEIFLEKSPEPKTA